MWNELFQRTELLIGAPALLKMRQFHVVIVGVGGVGAFAAEFIARAGVGKITVIDGDMVAVSNSNRQLLALHSTFNKRKAEVMEARLKDINPMLQVVAKDVFITPENIESHLIEPIDFLIDAIDSVPAKAALIAHCAKRRISIVSSMGAGGKLAVNKLEITEISKSHHCKLAKAVRTELRKIGAPETTLCVFSSEPPAESTTSFTDAGGLKRNAPGTISYLPALFGIYCCQAAIADLQKKIALSLDETPKGG